MKNLSIDPVIQDFIKTSTANIVKVVKKSKKEYSLEKVSAIKGLVEKTFCCD